MQTRYLYILRLLLTISDLLLINICFFVSFYLCNKYGNPIPESIYKNNVLICNLIWLLSTGICTLYAESTIDKLETIYRATWRSIALHIFIFLAYLVFSNSDEFPRTFIASFYTFMCFGFLLSRFTGTALEDTLYKNFDIKKVVAVLGMNQGGIKLAAYLNKQSSLNFVGFLGDEEFYIDSHGELIPAAAEQLKKASNSGIEEVFVSLSPDRMGDIGNLLREGEKYCVRLKFVPDLSFTQAPYRASHMGDFSVFCVRKEPLEENENRFKKRYFDIFFSLFVIVFVLSWLYPILALIIKIQSPGPILFKQLRSGKDNKPFYCYKFRSMRVNKDSNRRQATLNDDRITPIGKFMRRTSLDELPQFFNVLFGYMSVIGPRPHMLKHTEEYRAVIDQYMVRQFLKPGISGWAQVNGFRGETKHDWYMKKRVDHDIWYMENWSLMLDLRIVFMTIINIFKTEENAY